jgi:hypothetical protein
MLKYGQGGALLPHLPPYVTEAIASQWWNKSRSSIIYHVHRARIDGYRIGRSKFLLTADIVALWGPPTNKDGYDAL